MNALDALLARVEDQCDDFLDAVNALDGVQRELVLARGQSHLAHVVVPPRRRDEIPALGCWEAFYAAEQLERLMETFQALSAGSRVCLTAYARELKAAEPALPDGYSR